MIGLTRSEIEKLWQEYEDKNPSQEDWLWWDEFLIKAQLKKVVEDLKHSIAAEYYSPEAGCDIVAIPTRDWQALLEEVKE